MFQNFFRIAFRNLRKGGAFSFINMSGLAVGLAACMFIMLFIFDESRYDKHHNDGDRLFRIATKSDKGDTWAAQPAPLAWAVKNNIPEVEQATRMMTFPDIARLLIKTKGGRESKQFFETNGYYVDSTFFQVLSYPFLFGNKTNPLDEPNTIVISAAMSKRFFGDADPVGNPLTVNTPFGEFDYKITGVFDGERYKSHIPSNYFLSMRNNDMWQWVQRQTALMGNSIFFTYIKLKPGTNEKIMEKKLQDYYAKEAGADMKAMGYFNHLFLQPVNNIYLHSALKNEVAANGNISYLYILASIAAFILLIACINFMNLATAQSEKRAKEVGVKKVLGAERRTLVFQFMGESFLLCLLSLVLAFGVVVLLLPFFNQLTQKNIQFADEPGLLWWIAALVLITGLLAGLYPAFYLSAFKPISIIKGKIVSRFSAASLRKGLVVFQFTISVCLVVSAIIIWQQLHYLKTQELGFNQQQKLVLPLRNGYLNSKENFTALHNEIRLLPGVKSISSGSAYPGIVNLSDMLFFAEGKPKNENVDVHTAAVNDDYVETLGFKLLAGRSFNKNFTADSASIILNESAVGQLGYTPSNAIGRKVFFEVGDARGSFTIVGVLKDFNFESLHNSIQPYGFTAGAFGNKYGYVIADIQTRDYAALLKQVESAWRRLYPGVPFEYSFVDQDFQRNYQKEQLSSGLVNYFTLIAILIASLGLFGLAAFAAEQRKKEIGIRKVLGASVSNVTMLLTKEFIWLVGLGVLLAAPISWWAMNQWLQHFAYKISISGWVFVWAGLFAVLIAVATISFQSVKAALMNPVKSLRAH